MFKIKGDCPIAAHITACPRLSEFCLFFLLNTISRKNSNELIRQIYFSFLLSIIFAQQGIVITDIPKF